MATTIETTRKKWIIQRITRREADPKVTTNCNQSHKPHIGKKKTFFNTKSPDAQKHDKQKT